MRDLTQLLTQKYHSCFAYQMIRILIWKLDKLFIKLVIKSHENYSTGIVNQRSDLKSISLIKNSVSILNQSLEWENISEVSLISMNFYINYLFSNDLCFQTLNSNK